VFLSAPELSAYAGDSVAYGVDKLHVRLGNDNNFQLHRSIFGSGQKYARISYALLHTLYRRIGRGYLRRAQQYYVELSGQGHLEQPPLVGQGTKDGRLHKKQYSIQPANAGATSA
jgi:hypothetical protein